MPPFSVATEQSEYLSRVVEAAPQVFRRHQFFVWSQGDFQRWLPHKISICGAYHREQRDVVFDIFNSVPVPEDLLSTLRNPRSAFMQAALSAWRNARYQACRVSLSDVTLQSSDIGLGLLALGYQQFVVHGVTRPGRPEEIESFFVFSLAPDGDEQEATRALDMLLPCVHMTYQRVCVTERQLVTGRSAVQSGIPASGQRITAITEREREILIWVRDGMSNQQISEQLGISALTVKNHVQKILRKLGAANRAQAVAKAMSMNVLASMPSAMGDSFH